MTTNMRRWPSVVNLGALLFLLGVLVVATALAACARDTPREVVLFYEAACPECPETQRLEALHATVIDLGRADRTVTSSAFNIFTGHGFEAFSDTAEKKGFDAFSITLPALFVQDDAYFGEASILEALSVLRGK